MQEEMQQKDEKQEYQYFDMNAIKEKLEFSKENWEEGSRLLDSQFVVIENFFTGYYGRNGGAGQCSGKEQKKSLSDYVSIYQKYSTADRMQLSRMQTTLLQVYKQKKLYLYGSNSSGGTNASGIAEPGRCDR